MITTQYSTINGVKLPDEEIYDALMSTKTWFLDFETMPAQWNRHKQRIIQKLSGTRKDMDKAIQKEYKRLATNPQTLEIRLLQIEADKQIYVLDSYYDSDLIDKLLANISQKQVVGHNLKFDLSIIWHKYHTYPKAVFDTFIASQLIEHSRSVKKVKHGLGVVLNRWLGVNVDKTEQSSDWSDALTQSQIDYAVKDVSLLRDLTTKMIHYIHENFGKDMSEPYMGVIYNYITSLEMKFIETLVKMEIKGIPLAKDLESRFRPIYHDAEFIIKTYGDYFKKRNININSPQQIVHYFNSIGVPIKDSQKETLMHLAHPDAKKILSLRQAYKTITMLNDYSSYTDRIYPTFWQLTAKSGRMSSSNPNMQQIPRRIKGLIYADSCHSYDYPAIEMRIMAEVAKEQNMIDVFKSDDADIHTATAKLITGKDEITKEERTSAKAANFLLLYGGGSETFRRGAYMNYGLEMTPAEAMSIKNKFMTKYPNIAKLQQSNSELLNQYTVIKKRTIAGRVMIAHTYTIANNLPIQGTGADMIKLASVLFTERAERSTIVNIVHDEIVIEGDEIELLRECMETAANTFIKSFTTKLED